MSKSARHPVLFPAVVRLTRLVRRKFPDLWPALESELRLAAVLAKRLDCPQDDEPAGVQSACFRETRQVLASVRAELLTEMRLQSVDDPEAMLAEMLGV